MCFAPVQVAVRRWPDTKAEAIRQLPQGELLSSKGAVDLEGLGPDLCRVEAGLGGQLVMAAAPPKLIDPTIPTSVSIL